MFKTNEGIKEALEKVKPYQQLVDLFYYHQSKNAINTNYKIDLENAGVTDAVKLIAENQIKIFEDHFKGDNDLERSSFELFAQGLLFDNGLDQNGLPRRPAGAKIHMMDSDVTGFVVWHAFIRAVIVLGLAENTERWLQLDREIALSAAILSALIGEGNRPQQRSDPKLNQPLDNEIIQQLREYWMNRTFDQIDTQITELEKLTITEHI